MNAPQKSPNKALKAAQHFFNRTIWETYKHDKLRLPLRLLYSTMRFLAIVWHGIVNNRMLENAAALSYSTLIALGPMVAVAVMISGFIFQGTNQNVINEALNNVITFISTPVTVQVDTSTGEAVSNGVQVSPQIVATIEHLIASARSGAVGIVGSLMLIVICIQLIITIEKSLNIIWGIPQGRTMAQRVVFYWTFLSLGTLLGLTVLALLSVSTITRYTDSLPFFGETLTALIRWGAPLISFALIVGLLGIFYRFMPNTFVSWKAALGGGFIAVAFLFINKELSFLYVSRIVRDQSLYGSIGLLPIFMFGLYLFWIFILIGGQASYAFQNLSTLTSLKAWEKTSRHTQESLSLAALVVIARRFKNCERPPNVEELSEELHVPQKMLNNSLNIMIESKMINAIEIKGADGLLPTSYQPARPLETITLSDFRQLLDNYGNDPNTQLIKKSDPIVANYEKWLDTLYSKDPHLQENLDNLIGKK